MLLLCNTHLLLLLTIPVFKICFGLWLFFYYELHASQRIMSHIFSMFIKFVDVHHCGSCMQGCLELDGRFFSSFIAFD